MEMFFRQAGLLVEINGEGGVDDIFKRVLGSVERFSELQLA